MRHWLTVSVLGMLFLLPLQARGQTIFTQGQIDFIELGFDNSVPSDPHWIVNIFNDTTNQEFAPVFNAGLNRWVFANPSGAVFLVTGPQHLWTRPADNAWSFTGVPPNGLFRATPQNGDPGTRLIFGISTLSMPNGIFVNDSFTITLSVAGTGNPGHFSLYSNDDEFNNALGILGPVELSTFNGTLSFIRTSGTQNNYNLAFSDPGTYALDFQFSGVRTDAAGGGTVVSDFYRYSFIIAPIPEPANWALLLLGGLMMGAGVWFYHRRRRLATDQEIAQH
jgi:hypothetical protein